MRRLLREAHLMSKKALEEDPIAERFHSFNTVAVDRHRLEEAKEHLREFRKRFCKKLDKNCTELTGVYQLNIGFYRLDRDLEDSESLKAPKIGE